MAGFDDPRTVVEDEPEVGRSGLDRLRALRKQKHDDNTRVFSLPGYKGELAARYRVLPWEETTSIQRRGMRQAGKNERADIEMFSSELVNACVELLVPKEGTTLPVSDDDRWEPVLPDRTLRYGDIEIAKSLGIELGDEPRAIDILRAVFVNAVHGNEDRADYVLNGHHSDVMEWMRGAPDDEEDVGAQGEAEEAFRGE